MKTPRIQHRHTGFSLIEILIVLVIIVILTGLIIAGGVMITTSIQRNQTQTVLAQLAGVLTEYKAQVGDDANPDSTNNPPHRGYSGDITEFIDGILILGEDNPAERMLRSIDIHNWEFRNRYTYDNSGQPVTPLPTLIDAWGNEIQYLSPEGQNNHSDLDNTAKRQPSRPEPYFASAGPDEVWGTFTDGDINRPVAGSGAEDNLYSFELSD